MSRAQRLVKLLLLLQRRGRTTTAAAAAHLGVDRRIALDDLKSLAEVAPIRHAGDGRDAEWLLDPLAASGNLGPLDTLALQVGRDAVSFLHGTAFEDALERAVRSAPPVPPRFARHLRQKIRFKVEPSRRFAGLADVLDGVLDGLLRERLLGVSYDGKRNAREFEAFAPLTLLAFRRGLYLLGREPGQAEVVRLSVDRIRRCEVGDPFDYPLDWDPDPEVYAWWGVTPTGVVDDVVLRFDASVARYVADRDWHPTAALERHDDGSTTLAMRTGGAELVSFVLEWGEHVEVIRPSALRTDVANALRAALRQYDS